MERTALELIDKLIACWSEWDSHEQYYLTVLAPSIVRSDAQLMDNEKEIVARLRETLSAEDWTQLPRLIAQRRSQRLKKLASNRERQEERREAEWREAEERGRSKADGKRKQGLIARIKHALDANFLAVDDVLAIDPDAELISGTELEDLRTHFVKDWVDRELRQPLDSEQAGAVAATKGNIQVIARAGGGKTRTLVTRAIFLQKHCQISPRELLLLAFNKKAAEEMKGRLAKALANDLPHVMTFHALARALVHPEEELLFDDPSADALGLSREIQEVIDEHVRSEVYGNQIRNLMLAHFREDWERIVEGGFQLTMDEFLAHRRALPRESLKGDYVKSFGEKVIANALFEHGVEYQYERNFRWNDINYRPDFTIRVGPKGGMVIEYFGLKGDADYDEMAEKKRSFWAERDEWALMEFSPRDLAKKGVDGFVGTLLEELRKAGIPCQRRSEEEIWNIVKRRALDGFTSVMKTFIGRCRKRNLSPDDLNAMIVNHVSCSTAEEMFLDVGISVYRGYRNRLIGRKKEDFDGLMWRSAFLVREGQTRFVRDKGREQGDVTRLRFVMVDEFQDFSQMFFELLEAIRSINPKVQFFCVGDDWQAINAFAGSELRFFTGFDRYFQESSRRYIRTNYRSPRTIVELGNALMHGRGEKARPERPDAGWVRLCKLDEFRPTAPEQARHNGDEITPAVLRLVRSFLDRGLNVVMLARRNGVPWYINYGEAPSGVSDALACFLEHIRSYLPEEDRGRVAASTVHKYKGLEREAVIILDAVGRSYPLIHPNWVFLRLFGDSVNRIEDEERRLFYVAATRAGNTLALVTESPTESPYLADIRGRIRLDTLSWGEVAPAPSLGGARLEIRVFDAYDVRDQLKDLKYQWESRGKYWRRAVMAEGFSLNALLGQAWVRAGVIVEVYSETGQLLHRGPTFNVAARKQRDKDVRRR